MLKVSNKSTRKKCKLYPGGNYSEKNVWEEFHGVKFSEANGGVEGHFPEENYLGLIVWE